MLVGRNALSIDRAHPELLHFRPADLSSFVMVTGFSMSTSVSGMAGEADRGATTVGLVVH